MTIMKMTHWSKRRKDKTIQNPGAKMDSDSEGHLLSWIEEETEAQRKCRSVSHMNYLYLGYFLQNADECSLKALFLFITYSKK